MHKALGRLTLLLLAGFSVVAVALGYWQVVAAPGLAHGPYDPRPILEAARTERGLILDRSGRVLVESVRVGDEFRRVYHLPAAVHVTGYFSTRYGSAGVEQRFDPYLSGERSPDLAERIRTRLLRTHRQGSDVFLTIDADLQAAAAAVLEGSQGAIVMLDPRTGEVLAMVSSPYFDPNELEENWAALAEHEGRPFVNRAVQSVYTPGSTFKLVTAAAALDLGLVDLSAPFSCTQGVEIDELRVDCRNNSHVPNPGFKEAFAWSSNRTFALAGLMLGYPGPINEWLSDDPPGPYPWNEQGIETSAARLERYGWQFGFGRDIPFDLEVTHSRLKSQPGWTPDLLGQTAFGQGELAETPLLAALIASVPANEGRLPAPYLVSDVRPPDGDVIRVREPGGWLEQAVSQSTAEALNDFMVEGVERGYGASAAVSGARVGGKTGTAEVGEDRQPHAWFVGYAPADDPRVAIAVVMEHRGSGSEVAAPAAGRLLARALELYTR